MAFLVAAVLLVLVVTGLWAVTTYNRLVRLRTATIGSWAQVDVELQRRCDLIPNLVGTVKGAAGFESTVLRDVTAARTAALQAKNLTPTEREAPESDVTSALRHLFAVAENYPQLTATTNYLELQDELANTEDRIAAARTFYNQNVEEFNALQLTVPTRFVAQPFGFTQADFFTIDDGANRDVTVVDFGPDGR